VQPGRPEWGWQDITAVTRQHRGHRLGLLVKVAMIELLADREPGLRRIVTYNSEVNEHMVAVNERLGYQVTDYIQAWEFDVAALAPSPARRGPVGMDGAEPGQS
jgi:RimJ/RimL family protein N-acetyltransferase